MSLNRELPRFLVAGFSAVATDFVSYLMLIEYLDKPYAKGISFVLGSVVAFLVNKYWTFSSGRAHSVNEIFKFGALYMSTLIANVLVNQVALFIFPALLMLAFLMATGTSTVLNFLGMKFWVFKKG